MPFICLTNANIPDGVVQILDLAPNESQKNNSLDGPGQTRYVNRVENDAVALVGGRLRLASGVPEDIKGLAAYIADTVDPGGDQQATGTAQAAVVVAGDTLAINGVVFTAVEDFATGSVEVLAGAVAGDTVTIAGVAFSAVAGGANPALQQFDDVANAGSEILCAASLRTAINDAASQVLLTAALDALVAAPTGGTLTAAAGATAVVTLVPSVAGIWGAATLAESTAGVNFTLSGAAMTYTDPVAANQEFGSAAHYEGVADPNVSTATSLAATLNNAATDALLEATGGSSITAVTGGTDTVTMTADDSGTSGAMTLVSSDPLTIILSGTHLVKAMETWTADLLNAAAAALIARMDAATAPMTAVGINAALNAVVGISGIDIEGKSSQASVAEILSVLAGRGYSVPHNTVKDPTGFSWILGHGSFKIAVPVFGTQMPHGEWRPASPTGDLDIRERKGIRYTVPGADFTVSLAQGTLAGFANGVTLFPDHSLTNFAPTFYQPGPKIAQVNNARLVVVYDDDGTILA
jgi:hypothetical protein